MEQKQIDALKLLQSNFKDEKGFTRTADLLVTFRQEAFAVKPIFFHRVAYYNFFLEKWIVPIGIDNDPIAEFPKANVISWLVISSGYSRPEDDEKVVVKPMVGKEFIATYIKDEDIFVASDNDYYPAQNCVHWSKVHAPVLILKNQS